MRTMIMASMLAAAFATASVGARAQEVHYAGGPVQSGASCWVSTNGDLGYGYWKACEPARAMRSHRRMAKRSQKKAG